MVPLPAWIAAKRMEWAGLDRGEQALTFLLLALIALHIPYAITMPVDSDEPQHLHVVWAWAQGLLPYRDVFDNHAPLFDLLMAPLFFALGERADVVPLMRFAMLPLLAIGFTLTVVIGRRVWSRRTGLLGASIGALPWPVFLWAGQFRPDNLWTVMWLATVASMVQKRRGPAHGFRTGLLTGFCAMVSLKTCVLGIGLLLAGLCCRYGLSRSTTSPSGVHRPAALNWTWLIVGFISPILLVAAFFALHGALGAAWYGMVAHNSVHGLGRWNKLPVRLAVFTITMPLVFVLTARTISASPNPSRTAKRAFVVLGAAFSAWIFVCIWPLVTREDFLPLAPLLGLGVAGWLESRSAHPANAVASPGRMFPKALGILGIELALLLVIAPPWIDRQAAYAEYLGTVLRLAQAGDFVLDAKGESIYRPRPYFYALEGVTKYRIQRGLLPDDITARLETTGTTVVGGGDLSFVDQTFIGRNYLPISNGIWIAGRRLGALVANSSTPVRIDIAATYALVLRQRAGSVAPSVITVVGTRYLRAGVTHLEVSTGGEYALVWAPSLRRGLALGAVFPTRVAEVP